LSLGVGSNEAGVTASSTRAVRGGILDVWGCGRRSGMNRRTQVDAVFAADHRDQSIQADDTFLAVMVVAFGTATPPGGIVMTSISRFFAAAR